MWKSDAKSIMIQNFTNFLPNKYFIENTTSESAK